jgi:hypothetical protein
MLALAKTATRTKADETHRNDSPVLLGVLQGGWQVVAALEVGEFGADSVGYLVCLVLGESRYEAGLIAPAVGVEAGGTSVAGCGVAEGVDFNGGNVGLVGEVAIQGAAGDQLLRGDREPGWGDVEPVDDEGGKGDDEDGSEDYVMRAPGPGEKDEQGCRGRGEIAPACLVAVDELQLAG